MILRWYLNEEIMNASNSTSHVATIMLCGFVSLTIGIISHNVTMAMVTREISSSRNLDCAYHVSLCFRSPTEYFSTYLKK